MIKVTTYTLSEAAWESNDCNDKVIIIVEGLDKYHQIQIFEPTEEQEFVTMFDSIKAITPLMEEIFKSGKEVEFVYETIEDIVDWNNLA